MCGWIEEARRELLGLFRPSGAWGYRADHGPSSEATALACLGLWSWRRHSPSDNESDATGRGAAWLVAMQRTDGSVGVAPAVPEPGWPTPLAVLLWSVLGTHDPARRRATTWLLNQKGKRLGSDPAQSRLIVGHNPDLVGWPWVAGTHSWVEPTALAMVALALEGFQDHPRVHEGTRLLVDRALSHGGWNYGNTSVFGRQLRPQPGPTGQALLALATTPGRAPRHTVDGALSYLMRTLPDVRAPMSLSWGVLGLRAWHACPDIARAWLAESHARVMGTPDAATSLGLLLLAAGETTLEKRGSES